MNGSSDSNQKDSPFCIEYIKRVNVLSTTESNNDGLMAIENFTKFIEDLEEDLFKIHLFVSICPNWKIKPNSNESIPQNNTHKKFIIY